MKTCGMSGKEKRLQDRVLDAAKDRLMKIFGLDVVESEKKGCYMLINLVKENQEDDSAHHIYRSEKEKGQMAITFVVLGLIFMSNGQKISEENLFKFLKHLGLHAEDKDKGAQKKGQNTNNDVDPELTELLDGDAKKFINETLVSKQHYLARTRDETGDPEVESYTYSWGERARLEIQESDVLKMVCEIYQCEPKMFKEQYDRVIRNEADT